MTKPANITFNPLTALTIHPYESYLPTAFDESLSLLQKVNKVIYQLDSIGKLSNDLAVKWNEVITWISNEGVSESVIAKLNEMSTDGTLDNIINETIFEQKPNIYVSAAEPADFPSNSFWYQVIGV